MEFEETLVKTDMFRLRRNIVLRPAVVAIQKQLRTLLNSCDFNFQANHDLAVSATVTLQYLSRLITAELQQLVNMLVEDLRIYDGRNMALVQTGIHQKILTDLTEFADDMFISLYFIDNLEQLDQYRQQLESQISRLDELIARLNPS